MVCPHKKQASFQKFVVKQLFSSYFLTCSSDLTTSVTNEEPEAKSLEMTSLLKGYQAADPSLQRCAPSQCLDGSATCPLKEHAPDGAQWTQSH